MEKNPTVSVHMTPKLYRDFTLYDTYLRQKRWRQLALFAGILLVSAALCLYKKGYLLSAVLALIAVGLPVANIQNAVRFINLQCKRANLANKPLAYTLTFTPESIHVQAGTEESSYRRDSIHRVIFRSNAIYLYVLPEKAYLLPAEEIPGGADSLRQYFGQK